MEIHGPRREEEREKFRSTRFALRIIGTVRNESDSADDIIRRRRKPCMTEDTEYRIQEWSVNMAAFFLKQTNEIQVSSKTARGELVFSFPLLVGGAGVPVTSGLPSTKSSPFRGVL